MLRKRLRIVKTGFLNNHRGQQRDYGKPARSVGISHCRAAVSSALFVDEASIRTPDEVTVRFLTKITDNFAENCEMRDEVGDRTAFRKHET